MLSNGDLCELTQIGANLIGQGPHVSPLQLDSARGDRRTRGVTVRNRQGV